MPKGTNIGELEELILLTIGVIHEGAYSVLIKEELYKKTKRSVSMGALHTMLYRLEKKGFLSSFLGEATKVRGGKPKRYFKLTENAELALKESLENRLRLWKDYRPEYLNLNTQS